MSKKSDDQFRTADIRPQLEDLRQRFLKLFQTLAFDRSMPRDWAVCADCLKVLKPHTEIVDAGCIPIAKQSPPRKNKVAIVLEMIRQALGQWVLLPHLKLAEIRGVIPDLQAKCLELELIIDHGLDAYEIQGDLSSFTLVLRSELYMCDSCHRFTTLVTEFLTDKLCDKCLKTACALENENNDPTDSE